MISAARRRALERFADEFERGAHWDAHEHLEALWRDDRLDLWQALIQLAATMVLLGSARPGGARSVLTRARSKLEPLPTSLHGVDVGWLRQRFDALHVRLSEAQPPSADEAAALFEGLRQRLGIATNS